MAWARLLPLQRGSIQANPLAGLQHWRAMQVSSPTHSKVKTVRAVSGTFWVICAIVSVPHLSWSFVMLVKLFMSIKSVPARVIPLTDKSSRSSICYKSVQRELHSSLAKQKRKYICLAELCGQCIPVTPIQQHPWILNAQVLHTYTLFLQCRSVRCVANV